MNPIVQRPEEIKPSKVEVEECSDYPLDSDTNPKRQRD